MILQHVFPYLQITIVFVFLTFISILYVLQISLTLAIIVCI